jgi:hypothetical protein
MKRRELFGLFAASALGAPPARAQRSGDMRDPDQRYDEGWTSLFNGKDFGKLVAVLRTKTASPGAFSTTTCSSSPRFSSRTGC